ncbi:hypothetical protein OKC48_26025 [Methylorubrum extorquens]|uniref:hypothetical protein n=1 Tax=Methylorubrum extorquens TaxID=408 RepID=UPI0022375CA1|nr:hypothetical protein [Methylorubrum extorquens]UYW26650.1 hypothetical protein OKC48_26025 [Methylorubrum extorquens]
MQIISETRSIARLRGSAEIAIGVHYVVVRHPEAEGRLSPTRLWIAVLPREEAVEAVRRQAPEGWQVELAPEQPTLDQVAALNLRFGEVREITGRS